LFLVLYDEAVLQNDVEAGFDVVGIEDLLVLLFLFLLVGRGRLGLGAGAAALLFLVLEEFVVIDGDVVIVLVEQFLVVAESLEVLLLEVLGLFLFEFFVVFFFVSHSRSPLGGRGAYRAGGVTSRAR